MKKVLAITAATAMLLLSACGKTDDGPVNEGSVNDGEQPSGYGAIEHGVDEQEGIGFNVMGGEIEEAANVPEEEKAAIIETIDTYISTLNEHDIDGYLDTLSATTYNVEEERKMAEDLFAEFELKREISDVTIVKYDETEAQVFANLKTFYKQQETGIETNPTGRQVTAMTKEDGVWKVGKVYYMGDEEKAQ